MSSISPGDYPETLILEPGDDITARYQRLESGRTKDGEKRAIVILEIEGVDRSLWLHETALRGQFRELKPEPKELVRIRKGAGKKKGANGFNYWPFKVTAPERPPETIGWDSRLLSDEEEPEGELEPDVPVAGPESPGALEQGQEDNGDIPF